MNAKRLFAILGVTLILTGCSSKSPDRSDTGTDGSVDPDTADDIGTDTHADVEMDTGADTGPDTDTDTVADVEADQETDVDTDAGADADEDSVPNVCGDGVPWTEDCGSSCEACDDGNRLAGDYCGEQCATAGWHTFFGAAGIGTEDMGYDIVVHDSSSIYVAGKATTSWNGPGGELPLNGTSGLNDFYILKIDSAGTYQWHTFHGSAGRDTASSIATDGSGNVYVCGFSNMAWDGPAGRTPLHAYAGADDLFILKLDADGAYQWHTFYGSSVGDGASAIGTGPGDSVYVVGNSQQSWADLIPFNAHSGMSNIYILKLDSDGAYQWHTFHGSSTAIDGALSVAIQPTVSGNVLVAGVSMSSWDGPAGQAPQNAFGSGAASAMVLAVSQGGGYQWHAFYGSSSTSSAYSLAVSNNDVFVTGYSDGTWNGPGDEAALHAYSGANDVYVLALTSLGEYRWHTFYGTAHENESGNAIGVDHYSYVYVTGEFYDTWYGPGGEAPMHGHSGGAEQCVLNLSFNGAYRWHTCYGSASGDSGFSVDLDSDDNVYVAGASRESWSGPGGEAPLNPHSGGWETFVQKLAQW